MESNTNSVSECLAQMINLTKKNLNILQAINESFYTKRGHLAVNVNDEEYVIPSFISLETRIESLEENLKNIVDAPLTGEAYTYFDGTTQRIELAGYSTTPNHLELSQVTSFNADTNSIFKDFMSPNPFVKIDLYSAERPLPNNIKHVVVKKISIEDTATELRNSIQSIVEDGTVDYAMVEKKLYPYKKDVDYTVYDTVRRMPIRKGVAQGEYEIMDIIDNYQDKNFDEFYELTLNTDLVCYINNGTIARDLRKGDTLVTYNDKVMLEIVDLNSVTRRIKVKVLYGAYADLQDKTSGNPDMYKLKYYKNPSDIDSTKYIDVPLEEDRYVMIFIAPINDTTNTQAPWGRGVFIDVDTLKIPSIVTEEYPDGMPFRVYYDQFVNNIGDALAGITAMMDDDQQTTRLTGHQFEIIKDLKPEISDKLIKVTQINKHLNDTKSIRTIRNLYDQKMQYKMELDTLQRGIDQINKSLAELPFDDTTNSRTVYETQLSEYNQKKIELTDSLNRIMQEISVNANNSETPIENAKYRIRGFIPSNPKDINPDVPDYVNVIKLDVEYRYKNKSSFTGNAETYGEDYIYSDWNKMESIYRKRVVDEKNSIPGHRIYKYVWEDNLHKTNNPSFDQVDIPITQGEIVDIRVRFIYNLGYPFAEVRSDWSPIYTQTFPEEYTKNVEVLDIISENNDEIRSHHFENILAQKGIINHVDDELQDQTITYMHKAEHITSGFLTEERRVIPLDIKLQDFNDAIENLKSEVFGAASTNLIVTLKDSIGAMQLRPNIFNRFHTLGFKQSIDEGKSIKFGDYDIALSQLTLSLYNNGSYDMKLYSLFPGVYGNPLNPNDVCVFPVSEYAISNEQVFMMIDQPINNDEKLYTPQTYNQFIYFRRNLTDVNGTPTLYKTGDAASIVVTNDGLNNYGVPNVKMLGNENNIIEVLDNKSQVLAEMSQSTINSRFACMYPYPGSLSNISSQTNDSFVVLGPGESINIPINFVYWFYEDENLKNSTDIKSRTVTRMMAFDIRTSLYSQPISFKFVVDASYADTKDFLLRKAEFNGLSISDLPRLIPSTPKSVARNTSSLLRASNIKIK